MPEGGRTLCAPTGERAVFPRSQAFSEPTQIATEPQKAQGLSATTITRLKAGWEQDYRAFRQRDLSTAVETLLKDKDPLLALYSLPAEHWRHIRTTNAIESTLATVRLRTRVTKGAGSPTAGLLMAYKLLEAASPRWRALTGSELVREVLSGVKFEDGERKQLAPDRVAA